MFRVSKVGLNPAVGCAGIGGVWTSIELKEFLDEPLHCGE